MDIFLFLILDYGEIDGSYFPAGICQLLIPLFPPKEDARDWPALFARPIGAGLD